MKQHSHDKTDKCKQSLPKFPQKENELRRRNPVGASCTWGEAVWVSEGKIYARLVPHRNEMLRGQGITSERLVGMCIKIIDTANEADDGKAAASVEAELNRIRGEMREPAIQAVQLTGFWHINAVTLSTYAIYRPI